MGENIFYIVIIALMIGVLLVGVTRKTKKKAKGAALARTQTTNEDPEIRTGILDQSDGVMDVYIAGLAHHCTMGDVGVFRGLIYNDWANPVDRNAMAIWSNEKQGVIGYVPSAILDDYRIWSEGRKCSCVGVIFWNGESLRGRVRAYAGALDKGAVKDDMENYTTEASEHFGW